MRRFFLRNILFLGLFFALFAFFPSKANAAALTRSLTLGSFGPEVKLLQQMLNNDPDTLVAREGLGSNGKETSTFGMLTFVAVSKFQAKYKGEVLTPVGLSLPTGYVGSRTRTKLNSLYGALSLNVSPLLASPLLISNNTIDIYTAEKEIKRIQDMVNAAALDFQSTGKPFSLDMSALTASLKVLISAPSSYTGKVGDRIQIGGVHFEPTENRIHFGPNFALTHVPSTNGADLSFVIPAVPLGRYDMAVSNAQGVSNVISFVVLDSASLPVTIDTIEPLSVKFGENIVIHGSGFTATGNEIKTNLGNYKNVSSSDGKTMTIQLAPESLKAAASLPEKKPLSMDVAVYVVNDNGISKNPKFFKFGL